MRIDGHRRSDKFEDRGIGTTAARGGRGLPVQLLASLARRLGPRGTLAAVAVAAVGYFVAPASLRTQVLGALVGGNAPAGASAARSVLCDASAKNAAACDFSRVVLASTEDVWKAQFASRRLPSYGVIPETYRRPTLTVFSGTISTGGCGNVSSEVGPVYCPADSKVYIDPSFYDVMEKKLKAPGDFAQAYVIAHEVGHHVQNLLGSNKIQLRGEDRNQSSVRVELQADCLAGVWGHSAKRALDISSNDLDEALTAAHAIGDDSLGHADESSFTHGSSAQRARWFRRGFDNGDPRACDTFAMKDYRAL